jgi:hypothetical protein
LKKRKKRRSASERAVTIFSAALLAQYNQSEFPSCFRQRPRALTSQSTSVVTVDLPSLDALPTEINSATLPLLYAARQQVGVDEKYLNIFARSLDNLE